MRKGLNVAILGACMAGPAMAGSGTMDEVRLFQNYFTDAVTLDGKQVEAGLEILDDSGFSAFSFGARGDMPLNDRMDIGGSLEFISLDPDGAASQSGLRDPEIGIRLQGENLDADTHVSFGGLATLPIGDKDVGASNLDIGGFAAIRHAVDQKLVFSGKAALVSVETGDDRSLSLQLGGGAIYHYLPTTYLVSELEIQTETDYSALSFGADYSTDPASRLRASVQFGLDDAAADLAITASYLFRF
ncbi:MAG: transporter [bacterium]